MSTVFKIIGVGALIVVLVAIGPLLTIWAGNEIGQYLWPDRQVPYTIWTWLAVVIIGVFLRANVTVKRKD